jgi:putative ABC transport system permease protein
MTTATFILKNALRNKRRATLSVLSVAVSLFLVVTLMVGLREFTVPPEDIGASLRVVVRSKISIANFLPARQRQIIERIPGVSVVSPFTWFGGRFKNEESLTFAQFAMDPKQLRPLFGEVHMSDAEYEAFENEANPTACIVGKLTADKYKLKLGDRITLESILFSTPVELKIVGIYSGTIDDRNMFFRQDYLDRTTGNEGWVGTWWVKVRSAADMQQVIQSIDRAFANSSAEVRAETERAFQLSFVSMLGDVTLYVKVTCGVVIFTLILVTASTTSMAIRERFRELAVLKALGYRRRELFAFILAESFGLALFGALVGIGGAYLLYTFTPIVSRATDGLVLGFEVTPRIMGFAALVAAGIGIIASVGPALVVSRVSVVDGLKTLD